MMFSSNKIPEFNAAGPAARAAYEKNGAIILRRALSDPTLAFARAIWPAAFAIFDAKAADLASGQLWPDAVFAPEVDMFRRLQFIQHRVVRIALSVLEMRPERVAHAVGAAVAPMFDEGISFVEDKSAIRRQGMTSAFVAWHRDAHAVRLKEIGTCFNCWVPIHAVGRDRPSLQVVCGSQAAMRGRPIDYAEPESPTDDEVDRDYPGQTHVAMLDPGDMLVFADHTLHRTQPMTSHPGRISAEFRFTVRAG